MAIKQILTCMTAALILALTAPLTTAEAREGSFEKRIARDYDPFGNNSFDDDRNSDDDTEDNGDDADDDRNSDDDTEDNGDDAGDDDRNTEDDTEDGGDDAGDDDRNSDDDTEDNADDAGDDDRNRDDNAQGEADEDRHTDEIAEWLEMSQHQIEEWQGILQTTHETLQPLYGQLRQIEGSYDAEILAENPRRWRIGELVLEMESLGAEVFATQTQATADMVLVLDVEQSDVLAGSALFELVMGRDTGDDEIAEWLEMSQYQIEEWQGILQTAHETLQPLYEQLLQLEDSYGAEILSESPRRWLIGELVLEMESLGAEIFTIQTQATADMVLVLDVEQSDVLAGSALFEMFMGDDTEGDDR